MSFWTAIVTIVAIVFFAQMMRERREARHARHADKGPAHIVDNAREERLEAEIAELKDRIKVLERIAFDDRQRLGLADEIERLRD